MMGHKMIKLAFNLAILNKDITTNSKYLYYKYIVTGKQKVPANPTATQKIDSDQLSSAERLAKYDAFQAKVATKRKLNEAAFANLASMELNPDTKADNRVKSRLEILAEERDFKRRRQSYKGGKSGSLKRSYNEIIRDVIETQSDMLRTMNATNMEHVEHDILVDQT
ncbi:SNRNP48 [Bugula neritina]|uniref:SNRNP48 n=1 Tax=Bugula neritina TaxID=10212 RepID=A0A7J7JXS4_BUGNE|nr:SNRNP48 [Bugula neritina]